MWCRKSDERTVPILTLFDVIRNISLPSSVLICLSQPTLYPLQQWTGAMTFNVPQLDDVNGQRHGKELLMLPSLRVMVSCLWLQFIG